jgi:hypothetical protein
MSEERRSRKNRRRRDERGEQRQQASGSRESRQRDSSRGNAGQRRQEGQRTSGKKGDTRTRYDRNGVPWDRPRWVPPKLSDAPFPALECPLCGRAIEDISAAVDDKITESTVHFDCILARLRESERLGPGEDVAYLGAGRFGIVRMNEAGTGVRQPFAVRNIVEVEKRDDRAEWRLGIADHYSLT